MGEDCGVFGAVADWGVGFCFWVEEFCDFLLAYICETGFQGYCIFGIGQPLYHIPLDLPASNLNLPNLQTPFTLTHKKQPSIVRKEKQLSLPPLPLDLQFPYILITSLNPDTAIRLESNEGTEGCELRA